MSENIEKRFAMMIASTINETILPRIKDLESRIAFLEAKAERYNTDTIKGILAATMEHLSKSPIQDMKATLDMLQNYMNSHIEEIRTEISKLKDDLSKTIVPTDVIQRGWDDKISELKDTITELNMKMDALLKSMEELKDITKETSSLNISLNALTESMKETSKQIADLPLDVRREVSSIAESIKDALTPLVPLVETLKEKIESIKSSPSSVKPPPEEEEKEAMPPEELRRKDRGAKKPRFMSEEKEMEVEK
ncbi:MAG: hypothetical protein QXJ72_06930 [Thermoproteota archaeon]